MSTPDLGKLEELFTCAMAIPPEARSAYLAATCEDEHVRRRIERMIADAVEADGFLEASPILSAEMRDEDIDIDIGLSHLVGTRIGRYQVLRIIGLGGMGIVFEAQQESPNRTVALKLLRAGLFLGPARNRFAQEAEVLGRLRHPGIAQVLESGTVEINGAPQPFFAMELVDGQPITRYAAVHGLSVSERLELLARVCDAVEHAHKKGVIHRDLKPGNILVTENGQPKVLDFGVARATGFAMTLHTQPGQLIGTLAYMSPEQAEGRPENVDVRSDVYALGVVLYELLCARLPHDVVGLSIPEAVRTVAQDDPSRPSSIDRSLRGDIDTIVMKGLERERQRRYPSAAALATDLRRYLRDEPIAARAPSTIYQLRKFAKRNKGLVGGVTAAFAMLVGALVVVSLQVAKADRERARAELETSRERSISEVLESILAATDAYPTGETHKRPQAFGINVRLVEVLDETVHGLDTSHLKDPAAEATVRSQIALSYFSMGRYDEGARNAEWSLPVLRDNFGGDDRRTLDCKIALAENLVFRFDSYRAQRLAQEAVDDSVRVYGEFHEQTLRALQCLWLCNVYLDYDRDCAIITERMERILRDSPRHLDFPKFLPKVERGLSTIHLEHRPDAAEALVREGIEDGVVEGEANTSFMGYAYFVLALAAAERGEYAHAESSLRTGIDIWQRTAGSDAMLEFKAILGGFICAEDGKLDEGLALMSDAVREAEEHLGPDHPMTAQIRFRLASQLLSMDRLDEAEAEAREYLASVERGRHPAIQRHVWARNILAVILWRQGSKLRDLKLNQDAVAKSEEAERLLRDSIRSASEFTHDQWIRSRWDDRWFLTNLARALHDQGKESQAEPVYSQLRARADEDYGPWSANGISWSLCEVGRYADAEPYAHHAVDGLRYRMAARMDRFESQYVHTLDTWAVALRGLSRSKEAETIWREADKVWLRSQEKIVPYEEIAVRFGECLAANGNFEESERVLVRTVSTLKSRPDRNAGTFRKACLAAAKMYSTWGKPVEAAAFSNLDDQSHP